MSNITRYRADDYPERGTIRSGGVPLDIVGCTFLMTVNRVAKPVDTSDQVFQSIGEIVAPSANGQVEFPITGLTDPGEYFFDMEMTDTLGKVKTFKDGEYIVLQDITKSDPAHYPSQLWVPDGVDGEDVVMDGSEFWYRADEFAAGEVDVKYATREGTKVITLLSTDARREVIYWPCGAEATRREFGPYGIYDFEWLLWVDFDPTLKLFVHDTWSEKFFVQAYWARLQLFVYGDTAGPNEPSTYSDDSGACDHNEPGWVRYKCRVDYDTLTISAKTWDDGGVEGGWGASAHEDNANKKWPASCPYLMLETVITPTNNFELASFRWEQVG